MSPLDRDAILADAARLAEGQPGGTLATTHAEDGTPYVTFVLFHLRANGQVLFGSRLGPQHARNIEATREVSFLIDNREVVREDWTAFDRVVIEGWAREVKPNDPRHAALLAELATKNRMAAFFTEHGRLYCVDPRRLILMKGFEATRHFVDFEED
ncbi:MAG: pyridoxamine 5'-phosphate oxidase family protein [Dehalococcoidia bacterium]|nr:pyridoxamine 5'-phosphate oxidase family protein [Dehalococcoidia bacterium]